jgi:WD40 repeat protein
MTIGHVKLANETIKRVVIIGEKTGEAVAMPFPDLHRDLKSLLGHTTSMIRISQFPQTNIIQSYCLGHEASVTKIAVNQQLIVSIGIDATLKLWNLHDGTLLASQDLPLLDNVDKQVFAYGSLAICSKTNTIAVVYGHRYILFFQVDQNKLVTIPILTDMMPLDAKQPSEVCFTKNGNLLIAFKKEPFLQVFQVKSNKQIKSINPPWLKKVINLFTSTLGKCCVLLNNMYT